MSSPLRNRAAGLRLLLSASVAAGGLVAATVLLPQATDGPRASQADFTTVAAQATKQAVTAPTTHDDPLTMLDQAGFHVHNDPATKNSLSRTLGSADPTEDTRDPSSMLQKALVGPAVVEQQREEPDPTLTTVPEAPARTATPGNRYAMAGGCYALQGPDGSWVATSNGALATSASSLKSATPFHFQATTLGKYLLYGPGKTFLAESTSTLGPLSSSSGTELAAQPSESADWTVRMSGQGFTFRLPSGSALAVDGSGSLVTGDSATPFALHLTSGCAPWPEVQVNVEGQPFKGVSSFQEVRGYTDAHTHGMAFEFLGGDVHCGKPWDPYGVTYALVDCPDHMVANGRGALLEDFLSGNTPGTGHDPIGWPSFNYWPAPHSLTHEGTYYKWMERAWRGGLRVFVNLLVENNKLCEVYPIKHNSCNDMDSVRLQAADMYAFQDYIDAQYGGPGKGWYRIVTDPFQARKVVNEGKLAVIMGIETSVIFGCTMKVDVPQCTTQDIHDQLNEVYDLGVRQMELVNKFDNALSGVAGDGGSIGPIVNGANFLETGSFWGMKQCPASYPSGVHDNEQVTEEPAQFGGRDSIFAAIMAQYGGPVYPPLYPAGPHCNVRGLTNLGDYMIEQMASKHMLFDPDHMSVKARKSSLDLLEQMQYPGVVSSHSWSTPDAYPRIYKLGGFVAPYAGDSTGFVNKWKQHLAWADPRYYFGFGYGADINGFGAQGDPRGANAENPVTYPIQGLGGVTIYKQHSGTRVYDINVDGVAHYGLYPDWIQDITNLGGPNIAIDMQRGAEAYLQTWERAMGVGNDACRDSSALMSAKQIRGLSRGTSVRNVLLAIGQPHERLDKTFTYCAVPPSGKGTVQVKVVFDENGKLTHTT